MAKMGAGAGPFNPFKQTKGQAVGAFQQAVASLGGAGSDVERMHQQGRRRTLSDIAMQSVQSGMANTLNLPAAGIAYDQAVRPGTNVAVAGQQAGLLADQGRMMAGFYGTDVSADLAMSGHALGVAQLNQQQQQFQAQQAADQQALAMKRYLAELQAKSGGGGSTTPSVAIMGR
jgi:hypothetical protein